MRGGYVTKIQGLGGGHYNYGRRKAGALAKKGYSSEVTEKGRSQGRKRLKVNLGLGLGLLIGVLPEPIARKGLGGVKRWEEMSGWGERERKDGQVIHE
jgi:hypothetical protein